MNHFSKRLLLVVMCLGILGPSIHCSKSRNTTNSWIQSPSGGSRNVKYRDPAKRRLFLKYHSCPSTKLNHGACPGYVVDHIVPLECGGKDDPTNMQWQTVKDGLEKDKWERKDCSIY